MISAANNNTCLQPMMSTATEKPYSWTANPQLDLNIFLLGETRMANLYIVNYMQKVIKLATHFPRWVYFGGFYKYIDYMPTVQSLSMVFLTQLR